MTADRDLGRRLADHFAGEAPSLAPDWLLPSALTTIEATPQRRGPLAPWRFPVIPMYARLGAAAAAIVAVVALAAWQLNTADVAHPTSPPAASPSTAPTATPASTPAGYSPPALTATFTSDTYGLTISYPQGWSTLPGTTPWAASETYAEPQGDFLFDPNRQNLFLKLASQALDGTSFQDWSAGVFAGRGCTGSASAVTVDGAAGVVDDSCYTALVQAGGRGYLIVAHWDANLPELRSVDWAGWLREVLASARLHPEDAAPG